MNFRHLSMTMVIAGSLISVTAPAAAADIVSTSSGSSANWSGYVAGGGNGSQTFSSVSGSWVEPTASCTSGQGSGSFWVGLGGAGPQSQALEQAGTEADCSGSGAESHHAWYELVPSAPVPFDLTISPGDHISAKVATSGSQVNVSLADNTTGQSANKTLSMSNPDVSSAEWIAEAPSMCDGSGNCQPVPLANFGTVSFSNANATADGHTGTIADPAWSAQPVTLNGGSTSDAQSVSDQASTAGAEASGLSGDGSSFTVTYLDGSQTSAPVPSTASAAPPGYGVDPAYGDATVPYGDIGVGALYGDG